MTEKPDSHSALNGVKVSGPAGAPTPHPDLTTADHMEINAMATSQLTPHAGDRQDSPTPPRADQAAPTIEDLNASQTAWYSSNDEEIWHGGPYGTREEAEAGAKAEEHRLIMRATKGPIRVSRLFAGDSFLEMAEENLSDLANEDGDPILDFSAEACADFETRVRAAIDEWQIAHRLSPVAWRFDSSDPVEIAAWAKGGAA